MPNFQTASSAKKAQIHRRRQHGACRLAVVVVFAAAAGLGCPSAPRVETAEVVTAAPPSGSTLRFLSLAIRDVPPSVQDTTAFLAGERSIDSFTTEWLASPQHQDRLRRYFADFFGVVAGFTPFDSFLLEKNDSGVYRLANKPDCTLDEAVSAPAWWLDNGETILMCPTSTSTDVIFLSEDPEVVAACETFHVPGDTSDGCSVLCNNVVNQEADARCGCGPEQILCMPCEQTGADSPSCDLAAGRNRELERDFNQESVERGLLAYNEGLSWFDYIGGDFFYGTRALYLFYALGQGSLYTGDVAAADVLAQLHALPVTGSGRAPWPVGRLPRAGIVTSPAYLNAYNTLRGRARALSQRLLCHDVDETLNTDNFAEFVNPGLSQAERDHGSNPRCNFCHYGMDNQAGTLFGYHQDGVAQYDSQPLPVQLGHVFGLGADGPADLVRGYVERAPGFDECMARRAFTSLSGLSFDAVLNDAERAELTALARAGPKPLIEGILKSPIMLRAAPQ